MNIQDRAKHIRLIAMDVDGVMTDGKIILGSSGEELKAFHAHDGMGITMAHQAGLMTAVITGRHSEVVRRRGEELKIAEVHQAISDKAAVLDQVAKRNNLTFSQIAYIGDDFNDLPLFHKVGLAVAVHNAVDQVKMRAHYVTSKNGGQGAIRECIEFILRQQGRYDQILAAYIEHAERIIVRQ